jgi:glycosyltransferase involved in cell wall biosynthesis
MVIPAYNEEAYLPALLASVEAARQRYAGGPEQIEVIVGDNASTDRTAAIALAHGCRVVAVEKRCIAAARNGGASAATGDFLCFIDADSRIAPETFNTVAAAMDTGKVAIGASGVVVDRWSAGIFVTFAIGQTLIWLAGMDAGVVFCRREDFLAVGGYDENRLAAEDVDLMVRMKALGRKHGRRFVRLRGVAATTSTRKFDTYGDWHFLPLAFRIGLQMLFNKKKFERSARRYWYEGR